MKGSDFSPRELRAAAALVNSAMLETAEASLLPHMYSDAFSEKMRPLFQRARKDETRRTARRRLIAALLALVIGASVFLAFNDTARAAVQRWLRTVRETVFTYQTEGDDTAKHVTGCVPHWLPEGYELEVEVIVPGVYMATYTNSEAPAPLDIEIMSGEGPAAIQTNLYDAEYTTKTIVINDYNGDLFLSHDPNITSLLILFDEHTGASVSVMGCLDEEELLHIASSLEIQYE